jgi:hypothetical protein
VKCDVARLENREITGVLERGAGPITLLVWAYAIARFFASMARVLAGRLTNIAFNATTLNVAERISANLSEQPVKKSPA